MMILEEVGNKITVEDIQAIEEKNGKITDDYKAFLLQNNGGMPTEELYLKFTEPDTENNGSEGSDLHYFFDNKEIIEWYDNLTFEDLIPSACLPIACDSFDNVYMLNTEPGDKYGFIYFADADDWKCIIAAKSFTDFLSKLKN